MERETGIEPATNSLEGCDSTIELLPQVIFDCRWTMADGRWLIQIVLRCLCRNRQSTIGHPVDRGGFEPP